MKLLKEHSIFICILLLCLVLRLLPLFDYQFTYDELSGLERTQFSSFSEVMEKGVKIDAHPALVQLIIYYLTRFFGYTTWVIKLPFLLFGFGAIVYAYAFGLRYFSKQAGLLASGIFSFSLIFIFYAPIARMYIPGVFFSIALLYYFFRIFFQEQGSTKDYFLLGLFALLSALNHHINALFAFTVCASAFLFIRKANYKPYLLTCVLVILAYLPHLPVTLYQLSVPGIGLENGGWLEVPEITVIWDFLKTLLGTGRIYLVIFGCVILSLVLKRSVDINKKQIYLLSLFVLNFLTVYLYTVFRSPIFQYSVMLFSGTAFIVFVCSFIRFENELVFHSLLVLVVAVLLYKSYITKDYFNQSVKTVFEYQFERTIYYKSLYGSKKVYPVFFDADDIMKKIYFEKYQTRFDCKISSDSIISNMTRAYYKRDKDPRTGLPAREQKVSSSRLFSEFVSGLSCDYLILTSAMPQYQAIVQEHFPFLLENTQTQGINFKLYSRKASDKAKVVADDAVNYYSSVSEKGDFVYSRLPGSEILHRPFFLKVDSLNEFPFDARTALSTVTQKEGQVILVKAKLKHTNPESALEVCISATDAGDNTQYSYNAKAASDFIMKPDSTITIYSEQFNGVKYEQVKYRSNLTCYLWNRGKENFILEDFEIRVIDYWPRKWDQWD